jgi:two-component system, chemotaxis family, response regulator Rcp1
MEASTMIEAQAYRKPFEILLVEDNPGDADLARDILEENTCVGHIHHVENGQEAMDFLRRGGRFSDAVRPDLILLDLNLPMKSGFEVLAEVKNDETLKSIPVIVLSASDSQTDIKRCYANFANCFITKPMDVSEYCIVVHSIENFWFMTTRLPKE